jgi:hypothetical protein
MGIKFEVKLYFVIDLNFPNLHIWVMSKSDISTRVHQTLLGRAVPAAHFDQLLLKLSL